ncbi:MAG: trehalase family glycosidase [Candidatus Gastranaerophilales bacterium]|nr:trehalase family glycosidase [Candidatus Gastranaerophilales bacterium]
MKTTFPFGLQKINILTPKSQRSCYEQSIKSSKVFNDPVLKKLFASNKALRNLGLDPDNKFYADLIPKDNFKSKLSYYYEVAKIKLSSSRKSLAKRIGSYLDNHFNPPNDELIKVELPKANIDYGVLKSEISKSTLLKDRAQDYTEAAKYIDDNWGNLYRRTPETTDSSLIPLPKPFVVPGGRFREIYYWDSYFTTLGLNRSKRSSVSEDMTENFLHLVDKYGFIPNGNRTYYLSRSQPPVFGLMVDELKDGKSKEWLGKYYNGVKKEYDFWMKPDEHYVSEVGLNRFFDSKDTKRIESFGDDNKNMKHVPKKFYQNERAICESGLDFSKKYSDGPLNVIPIELNSLLYKYETLLGDWAMELGKPNESKLWQKRAQTRKENMFKYLYDEKTGVFKDYNFKKKNFTNTDNLMMNFPLFVGLLSKDNPKELKIASNIKNFTVENFEKPHGVILLKEDAVLDENAFIKKEANEYQWDSPNGWAPLQYITAKGFENYGFEDDSNRIMKKWLDLNTDMFKKEGKFFEKYNVVSKDENAKTCYPEQDGFGWTNGIYLEFLHNLKSK